LIGVDVGGHESPATRGSDETILTTADILDSSAGKWAERVAIVDGERRCTYGELRRRALTAAGGFVELGVRKGDRVALCMPNGLEWVVAFFGAIYAGAVVVPLNTALSAQEIEYQVGQSGATVLVVCAEYRNRDYLAMARQVRDAVGRPLAVVVVDDGDDGSSDVVPWARLTRAAPADAPLPSLDEADPAIMLYTSGGPRERCTPIASSPRCSPASSGSS
jgi:acyl-CoA synthetase (AMP-forming)/AMP-acid ligase II